MWFITMKKPPFGRRCLGRFCPSILRDANPSQSIGQWDFLSTNFSSPFGDEFQVLFPPTFADISNFVALFLMDCKNKAVDQKQHATKHTLGGEKEIRFPLGNKIITRNLPRWVFFLGGFESSFFQRYPTENWWHMTIQKNKPLKMHLLWRKMVYRAQQKQENKSGLFVYTSSEFCFEWMNLD